jgi:hypothetical protein
MRFVRSACSSSANELYNLLTTLSDVLCRMPVRHALLLGFARLLPKAGSSVYRVSTLPLSADNVIIYVYMGLANSQLDVRVSKAMGSRGYDKVRLSGRNAGWCRNYSELIRFCFVSDQ